MYSVTNMVDKIRPEILTENVTGDFPGKIPEILCKYVSTTFN